MAGILFVHGGDRLAREVFATEGRAEWSQALPLVLEKHGYLSLEEAGPEALRDEGALDGFDAVLVARMPAGTWTTQRAQAIMAGSVPVLAEGPFPVPSVLAAEDGEPAPEDGAIVVVEPALRAAAEQFGAQTGAPLTMATRTPVDRDPDLDWTAIPEVPLIAWQTAAWRARGWDVQRWSAGAGTAVLCEWVSREHGHDRFPAIARRGSLTACSFGLFAFLAQRHSIEPFEGAEWRSADRCLGLEITLLALLDEMHRRSEAVRARVLPWPAGRRWACNVRHDVSAEPNEAVVARVLEAHAKRGTAATWYWPLFAAPALARPVARADHQEVGLSAERLWAGQGERERLEGVIGEPVNGMTSRASSVCFRFQGAANLLWAEREQFAFTELLGRSHLHPHRAPVVESDGRLRPLVPICLPHYESLDALAGEHGKRSSVLALWIRAGGLLQLTQRLDGEAAVNIEDLSAASEASIRWDVTAGEAADWWRRTHVRDELKIRALGEGRFELIATEGAQAVSVELLHPDGVRDIVTVDVRPGKTELEARPRTSTRPVTWDQARPVLERNLEAFYIERGRTPSEPRVRQTIAEDTVHVATRGETLVQLSADLAGYPQLEGVRVLDVGCGFGGLSTYLAWRTGAHVLATDIDPALLATGVRIARELNLDGAVQFLQADMQQLSGVADASVDLVVANGVLFHARTGRALSRTLREFGRVLAPGGHLVVYHQNRLRWHDPLTGRPLFHLLPRVPQRGLWGALGPKGEVWMRWLSPFELRRRLRRAGFRDVRVIGFGETGRHDRGPVRYLNRAYAVGAVSSGRLGVRTPARPPRPGGLRPELPIRDWDQAIEVYEQQLSAYYRRRGSPLDTPAAKATIKTNTVLVPQRGDNLLRYLSQLLGYGSCEGLRVLEVGCGFGALASYLLWRGGLAELVAVDIDDEYLAVANACARELGVSDRLHFVKSDMRTLDGIGEQPFDLILLNNSFIYLPSADAAREALGALHAHLVPGGGILFFHANKWRLREPFTKAPLIHLLRPGAAQLLSRITGWRHNHGRVRLLSPPELRRHLRRTGFVPVATMAVTDPPRARGLRRNFGTFTVQAARRES